jgi:hypothetical protein
MSHRRAVSLMVLVTLLWSIAGVVARHLDSAHSFEVTFWRSLFNALALSVALTPPARTRPLAQPGCMPLAALVLGLLLVGDVHRLHAGDHPDQRRQRPGDDGHRSPDHRPVRPPFPAAPAAGPNLAGHCRGRCRHRLDVRTGGAKRPVADRQRRRPGRAPGGGAQLHDPAACRHRRNAAAKMGDAARTCCRRSSSAPYSRPPAPCRWPIRCRRRSHDLGLLALLGVVQLAIPCLLVVRLSRELAAPEIALLGLLEVVFGVTWAWLGAGEQPGAAR